MPVDSLTKDNISKGNAALFDLMTHGRLLLVDEQAEVDRKREHPELNSRTQTASRQLLAKDEVLISWQEYRQTIQSSGGGGAVDSSRPPPDSSSSSAVAAARKEQEQKSPLFFVERVKPGRKSDQCDWSPNFPVSGLAPGQPRTGTPGVCHLEF
eukprot:8530831-Pyramimonas_sp.AAC.1